MGKKNKLKGLKRVKRIINEHLEQFGVTAKLSEDFYYDMNKRVVGFALATPGEADAMFDKFCKHLAPHIAADDFLLSIYHEVGHAMTYHNYAEADWDAEMEFKDVIGEKLNAHPKMSKKLNNVYFNLKTEKDATQWGLNYMENHVEEVSAFWNELQPAIMRFYRKNGVID